MSGFKASVLYDAEAILYKGNIMNRTDLSVSAASGALTALIIDTFLIGDISLIDAKKYGEDKFNRIRINS